MSDDTTARLKEIRESYPPFKGVRTTYKKDSDIRFLLSQVEQLQQQLATKDAEMSECASLAYERSRLKSQLESITELRQQLAAANVWKERWEKAVNDEPELPGDMPDEMWKVLSSDRDAATEALRILVRQTKEGILKRMQQLEERKE